MSYRLSDSLFSLPPIGCLSARRHSGESRNPDMACHTRCPKELDPGSRGGLGSRAYPTSGPPLVRDDEFPSPTQVALRAVAQVKMRTPGPGVWREETIRTGGQPGPKGLPRNVNEGRVRPFPRVTCVARVPGAGGKRRKPVSSRRLSSLICHTGNLPNRQSAVNRVSPYWQKRRGYAYTHCG